MSNITTLLQEQEKILINKKSLHQRNDSRELDVFEAARYFSGANEILGRNSAQKSNMKDDQPRLQGGRRMSLDLPSMRNSIPSQSCKAVLEKPTKEKKQYKQPSSPGGKLASFLNSLFNQTSSKKKKSKSTSTQSMKDEDESPGGRRKRRSSISHFRSAKSNIISHDSKSMYSTSSTTPTTTTTTTSGFRTPPPYGYMVPTKTCKDLRSYSDHKPILTNINVSKTIVGQVKDVTDYSWLDEKFRFRDIGFLEKHKINLGNNNGLLERGRIWGDKYQTEEKENFKRFSEEDEGGDSDSSSDLFELRNCDLGYYSSGLPVYETTHMDSAIKRGAPISTGGPN